MAGNRKEKRTIKDKKFTMKMQKKLVVLFVLVLLAFVGLSAKLILIIKDNGENYKKQVLSQQQYDSTTLPFRRGDILDAKGSLLATSEKVYNVVLDTKVLLSDENYLEPTLTALVSQFGLDEGDLRAYVNNNPTSAYYILKKRLSYDEISGFLEMMNNKKDNPYIGGVWFEEEYKRYYPNGSLACDAVGFSGTDNNGMFGLEEYYNDILNGTNGREYGYLNDESTLERTTKAATDGQTIVSTIDANIQSIVEKYLLEFNEAHTNEAREGTGSNNTGCIIMNVHTGEVLAMASYPVYDLNDPKNISALYTEDQINEMKQNNTMYDAYNKLWRNFCVSDTYEPGSTAKPFTVAAGLESGKLTGNESYTCNGSLEIGGHKIKCHNTYGDGAITVKQAVEKSCNVALMYMGQTIGVDIFTQYQRSFNFGLKTNIDLAGEARTSSLIYTKDTMGPTELATSTFGQGFKVTMIQMITGFCSLINGGYYYEPHVVNKIQGADGTTVETIEPRVLKQTISQSTSDTIIDYCNGVVTEGTGHTARPAGYAIGGKTGTAETLPRGNHEYVVSFMGYAPAVNPQIAIYVVVDRPNVAIQDDAKYATGIVRNILTEVLPYLNIFMTEELSEDEIAELAERKLAITTQYQQELENDLSSNDPGTKNGDNQGDADSQNDTGEDNKNSEDLENLQVWKDFAIDPKTGYALDPNTGALINPETGATVSGEALSDIGVAGNDAVGNDTTGDDGNQNANQP